MSASGVRVDCPVSRDRGQPSGLLVVEPHGDRTYPGGRLELDPSGKPLYHNKLKYFSESRLVGRDFPNSAVELTATVLTWLESLVYGVLQDKTISRR